METGEARCWAIRLGPTAHLLHSVEDGLFGGFLHLARKEELVQDHVNLRGGQGAGDTHERSERSDAQREECSMVRPRWAGGGERTLLKLNTRSSSHTLPKNWSSSSTKRWMDSK